MGTAWDSVDLSFLSEEERNKLKKVVQRDLEVRHNERERLKKHRTSILRRDREAAVTCQTLSQSTNCVFCGQKFMPLINPKQTCHNCGRPVCKRCSENAAEHGGSLCRLCLKEFGYRAMRCNWFYDTVISRFREFGSTTVAKTIFGDKYAQIQNVVEDELSNILDKPKVTSKTNAITMNEKNQPESDSFDAKREAQLQKLRTNLRQLMQQNITDYQAVQMDPSLNTGQKQWKMSKLDVDFRKEASKQLRASSQTLYIITERDRTMKGTSSRNITQEVIQTLENEVSNLIGRRVKNISDDMSIASDDDLDSVAYAERDGAEERLAQELLTKVVEDRSKPALTVREDRPKLVPIANENRRESVSNDKINGSEPRSLSAGILLNGHDSLSSEPEPVQKVSVVEGCPTRMEKKVSFNETADFTWLHQTPDGKRKPVKLDFHIEHVITGSTDPEGIESFVLSNSGHFGSDTFQSLIKMDRELKQSGRKQGVIIQHQLIIWAAKPEDAGSYFAVTRIPAGSKMSAVDEAEFQLEVIPAPRWPLHPNHSPDFVTPLTCSNSEGTDYVEFHCIVASNPPARCLFYRNSSPIPVVIMPPLSSEQERSEHSLSSFSRKFTVISSPQAQGTADMSTGYLRKLVLRVRNLTSEDHATYICRAWNRYGRVESSVKFTGEEYPIYQNGPSPTTSLEYRMNDTRNNMLNTAREIEKTAETHGDLSTTTKRVNKKPPTIPVKNSKTDIGKSHPVRTVELPPSPPSVSKKSSTGNGVDESPSPSSDLSRSPFVRGSTRRSSRPSIVVDRRSQRRRRSSTASSINNPSVPE